jgi:hypothetical protein
MRSQSRCLHQPVRPDVDTQTGSWVRSVPAWPRATDSRHITQGLARPVVAVIGLGHIRRLADKFWLDAPALTKRNHL